MLINAYLRFMTEIQTCIASQDLAGLNKLLSEKPALANAGIPYDETTATLGHPLHRLCDSVFAGVLSDEQAVAIARVFLQHGADVNGGPLVIKKDTPLIAAASLLAEKVGLLYMDHGADIHHAGTHGGTALHWAAWTGQDTLVDRLIRAGADIHKPCMDFASTPLLWAIHGYKAQNGRNIRNQVECVRLLLDAGADKHITNNEGTRLIEFLDEEDVVLKDMIS
jgi:ankyrin repeat protein